LNDNLTGEWFMILFNPGVIDFRAECEWYNHNKIIQLCINSIDYSNNQLKFMSLCSEASSQIFGLVDSLQS
jgi:hypothetical protein